MMTEHMQRQPLGALPISASMANIMTKQDCQSPSDGKKRQRAPEADSENQSHTTQHMATPKKAIAPPTANGRRSVKRIKVDYEARQSEEIAAIRQRSTAEAEYRLKMKAWIASYKKEFPTLHFYFDACPDDDVRRCTRKITFLGGSVEQFFSNAVNVVVTTRDINKLPASAPQTLAASAAAARHVRDIPSATSLSYKTSNLSSHIGMKMYDQHSRQDLAAHDVLVKAQNLNMKIWTLKKLRDSVLKNLVLEHTQPANERSLSTTLHAEKFVGYGEENIAQFKGPYLLVRDMNEEYRPIMCREWSNVVSSKDGDWPQWRSTKTGRCPFVRDKRAETQKATTTRPYPLRTMHRGNLELFNHAAASGIQQITSAIQSNVGRSTYSGKENPDSGVSSLLKKAVTARRTVPVANTTQTESQGSTKKVGQKAGFCENCREKFDDFDTHLTTRTHKAYAKNEKNFADLDELLRELVRGPASELSDNLDALSSEL